jgi:hypothetical protein
MKKYELKNYSRFTHLLHFHSWFPLLPIEVEDGGVSDLEEDALYPSLTLLSQNKLSTSFLTASYNGNPAYSHEKYQLSYDYNGFYPKLGLDLSWGDFEVTPSGDQPTSMTYKANNFSLRPSVALPLSYKRGVYSLYFSNQVFGEYRRINVKEVNYEEDYFARGFTSAFVRAKQSAVRDLYSPMRQQFSFYLSYDDFFTVNYRLSAHTRFNFPGFFPHHSFKLGVDWQQKDLSNSNAIARLPKGYTSSVNTAITYASTDYTFPLGYPDVHLGSVVNIKRYSLALYGDLAQITDAYGEQDLIGAGASLFFDMNFLRYEVDVRLGVQYGVMSYSANRELDFPLNFILNFNIF